MNPNAELICPDQPSSTVEILWELGSGDFGTVYVGRVGSVERALKVFYDGRTYHKECRAYNECRKIEALNGRIPSYRGSISGPPPTLSQKRRLYHSMICIDIVSGQTLNTSIHSLPSGRLQKLENLLLRTLQIMHDQAGVCHGDVQAGNIMLLHDDGKSDHTQAVLLDFSHACFKTDLHPKSWTSRKERDYAMLQSTFAGAKASLATEEALALMNPSIADDDRQQAKLAGLINVALPSSRLLTAIRSIESPIPVLALSIVRALSRGGQNRTALNLLEKFAPAESPNPSNKDNRSLMQLRGEQARLQALCSLSMGINSYPQVIAECVETLGATDNYTLSLRFAYAHCLRIEGQRKVDVTKTYLQMLDDLHKSELQDGSHTGGQSISASEAETWKRRLMNITKETLRDMEDQKVQAEARIVLQRVTTPCIEQHATQQAVTGERFKRKLGATDVNVVDGLAVHHSKRGKSSTGSPEENDHGPDKENVGLVNVEAC